MDQPGEKVAVFDIENIPDAALGPADVPGPEVSWLEINRFALTIDGYARCGGFEGCAEIGNGVAAEFRKSRVLSWDLSTLRLALFFEQRRWRHFGDEPEGSDLEYIKALVARITEVMGRRQVNGRGASPSSSSGSKRGLRNPRHCERR